MSSPWTREAWRFIAVCAGSAALGLILGSVSWMILTGVLVYLAWHARNLYRLERWLSGTTSYDVPDDEGIWSEIYNHFYQLQRRNRRRKRRMAAILREFRQSTAAMPDGTVVLSPDLRIVWFNEAARRLLDLRPGQDTGQHIANLIRHPAFSRYLKQGSYREAIDLASPVNRRQTLSVQLVPYGDEQLLLIVRDVTRVRQLEQIRRDFVANASHELRTPLTVISGYLDALLGAADDAPEGWLPPLHKMRDQASRMERILDDLLTLSSMDRPALETSQDEVDMPRMLEELLGEARELVDGRLTVELDADRDLRLYGIPEELRGIAANLVTNAVKYTPAGGEVTIEWRREGDGARLAVSDTGIGIPDKHIPRITERFYRVDTGRSRAQGGTGLGLAIVKHGLNRHDASLAIDSTPGRGSTFSCHFPRSRVVATDRRTA